MPRNRKVIRKRDNSASKTAFQRKLHRKIDESVGKAQNDDSVSSLSPGNKIMQPTDVSNNESIGCPTPRDEDSKRTDNSSQSLGIQGNAEDEKSSMHHRGKITSSVTAGRPKTNKRMSPNARTTRSCLSNEESLEMSDESEEEQMNLDDKKDVTKQTTKATKSIHAKKVNSTSQASFKRKSANSDCCDQGASEDRKTAKASKKVTDFFSKISATRRSPRRHDSQKKDVVESSLQETDTDVILSTFQTSGRSTRAAASRATRKMADCLKELKDTRDDKFQNSKRKQTSDNDEEFETEDDSDSSGTGFDEDGDDLSGGVQKTPFNVDVDASFLDAEESDDDGPKSTNSITPPSLRRSVKQDNESNDELGEDSDREDSSNAAWDSSSMAVLASPHMPLCQSTTDAITLDTLPSKHICFFMPDGKTKQCFALETLHKIALSEPVVYVNEKATFKQPPHFRTPMSAEMLDQIASRFGRAAIDVRGHFYNPGKLDFDYTIDANDLVNDEEFVERVNKYVNNCMGSRDIYCCPICYTEAHRRLESNDIDCAMDDDSSEDETENINLEFVADPMTIVGCVDGEEFGLASSFCFGKLVQLKEHLRRDHFVKTSDVQGNDLYKRFQIRAADGLLQRYLDKIKNKNHKSHRISKQGEMVRYWFSGNNERFVYLLDLMDRWNSTRSLCENKTSSDLDDDDDDDDDDDFASYHELYDKVKQFWSSFANRARRIWEVVSEPYQKETKRELDGFLDDREYSDNDIDTMQYRLINREIELQQIPEDEIVAALRQSRGKESEDASDEGERVDDDVEDDGSFSEEESFASSSVALSDTRRYYSEESEEDEWEQNLKSKRKTRIMKDRIRRNVKIVEMKRAKKLGGEKNRVQMTTPPPRVQSQSDRDSGKKRRLVIADSDSE